MQAALVVGQKRFRSVRFQDTEFKSHEFGESADSHAVHLKKDAKSAEKQDYFS